jgi:hypothetical protein
MISDAKVLPGKIEEPYHTRCIGAKAENFRGDDC